MSCLHGWLHTPHRQEKVEYKIFSSSIKFAFYFVALQVVTHQLVFVAIWHFEIE